VEIGFEVNKMTIIINNLRRPGLIYDSSKLAILINKITSDINNRTDGKYITKGTISGESMQINVKMLNPITGKYVPPYKNEQEILAGRISTFLNVNGVAHDIRVK